MSEFDDAVVVPSFRRMRRLRRTEPIRRLVRETQLSARDFIFPLFVTHGHGVRHPIVSMPGQFQLSVDELPRELDELRQLGIGAVLLFGIPEEKDREGSGAYDPEGPVQRAVRTIKAEAPDIVTITDVCGCEYTDHGHCGVIDDHGEVDNDATLERYGAIAVAQAAAGAQVLAPSGMMDGQVAAIRDALDDAGHAGASILAYSAKYASALYGPFRDAAECAPSFGDRRSYQMDPPNAREALEEVGLDLAEGADMVMVKPALAYLDIIASVRSAVDVPLGAYHVSGEYAMVHAAAQQGWIDGDAVMREHIVSIRRAGADFVLTYFARALAEQLSA